MTGSSSLRALRLQALMARQLENWREAWRAYASGAPMPVLRFRNGVVLHSGPGDSAGFLFLEIFANGCYRRGLPAAVNGEVVDIGANIGAFTVDIATRYPGIIVHAYEPNPPARERLQQNVEANGLSSRVRIWSEAVSGQPGIATLWRGDGSIAASGYLPTPVRGEPCDVATVMLPAVVARTAGRVAVLKLDCEGAEADILEAAGPALDAVDYIVGEYHPGLVADVLPRLRRVLDPSFDVAVTDRGRCGTMIRARRLAASNPRAA
jgi:FkbM family methyltransferase